MLFLLLISVVVKTRPRNDRLAHLDAAENHYQVVLRSCFTLMAVEYSSLAAAEARHMMMTMTMIKMQTTCIRSASYAHTGFGIHCVHHSSERLLGHVTSQPRKSRLQKLQSQSGHGHHSIFTARPRSLLCMCHVLY